MSEKLSAELLRETGKALYLDAESDKAQKTEGVKMLIEAKNMGDLEAMYIVAHLFIKGVLRVEGESSTDHGLMLMCIAANKGSVQARTFLDGYCELRYKTEHKVMELESSKKGLVDFKGKPIKINRTGLLTPIDAVLECEDGQNVLTLSANVKFFYTDDIDNPEDFERAVYRGILEWQGEYEVFGGQKLSVRVNLTNDDKILDNLLIIPVTDGIVSAFHDVSNVFKGKRAESVVKNVESNRSFATLGIKWSAKSRKTIFIQSESGNFDEYDEIMHVAKHEFGHALGLGDLYENSGDSLAGVERGSYSELDSYYISDKIYNLVMCDHHGSISNNDIEMVVLASEKTKYSFISRAKSRAIYHPLWEREINMKNIESFKMKFESFLTGCDSIEEMGLWDKENYGEMDSFYANDLASVIIRIIATDGKITKKEVDYLNDTFDFDYSLDELYEVYDNCRDDIGNSFDESFENGITIMRNVNSKLADAYKELLCLICDIIIESDGVISESEIAEVENLKALCK